MRMNHFSKVRAMFICLTMLFGAGRGISDAADSKAADDVALFARTNLFAWCIVPFDAKKRGPEERAEMLERLGFKTFVYDYRAEHIPTFDAEIEALQRHHITLLGWWFPTALNDEARLILGVLKRHHLQTQLWVMGGGEPTHTAEEQKARVQSEAERIRSIAVEAAKINCSVELYNHGGWFGNPDNQIAIIEVLHAQGVTNLGIVYNLHHGHDDLDRFPELMQRMKPYLVAINLNGMVRNGDKTGKMILPLGEGDFDLTLLKTIRDSGWHGPIGILNHTDEDAEKRLRQNLEGLDKLVSQLHEHAEAGKPANRDYWAVEDAGQREKLPLYETIPASKPEELTPANGFPKRETFLNWHRSHGDNSGARYSALDQITSKNVTNLQVAWTYHSKDKAGNIQCNPIIANGVMFAPTPDKSVVAVNAENGVELWRFKPEGRPAFRGLIYWPGQNGGTERVMFSAGKFLYALNPKTGLLIDTFGRNGRVELPGNAQGDFGASTAAPTIFERTIIVPGFEKDVWAFDAVTGGPCWTFHTVPHAGEFGSETWDHEEKYGANCWAGMALDEVRGIAYITTGSPKENFIGVDHHGQNLFANCILALDARTGKRLWHFQEIRHDIWDLDISAPPNLTTITRYGRCVDVVAAVTKMGNTLLLDRVTGKPIFPFRLRRAPTGDLPGEMTWPYQPDVELPEPFAKQEFTVDDITDRSDDAHEYVLNRFNSATTGWFRPFSEGKLNLFFGLHGGAEWTGACVDPTTGRLYVSANRIPWIISVFRDDDPPEVAGAPKTPGQVVYELRCASCHGANRIGIATCPPLRGLRHRLTDEAVMSQVRNGKNSMPAQSDISEADLKALVDFLMFRDRPLPAVATKAERPHYTFNGYNKFLDHEGYPASKPPWGTLVCMDLNTGKILWRVPLGEHKELAAQGVKATGTENFGGPIVTAGGLVFCSGTRDSKIRAFDKDTGRELWSAKLPWVGSAPPATYEVNGRQYVVIAATGGGKLGTPAGDAYLAFSLPAQ
jgi:quinoprotein glucose dehydrogenase